MGRRAKIFEWAKSATHGPRFTSLKTQESRAL